MLIHSEIIVTAACILVNIFITYQNILYTIQDTFTIYIPTDTKNGLYVLIYGGNIW